MATWVAHLRIAEILYQTFAGIDPVSFSIGSVAPDHDIPDNIRRSAVIPGDSHFRVSGKEPWGIGDLEFYRRYVGSVDELPEDSARLSFLLGYAFHLVTDNLWNNRIFGPTRVRFREKFEADPNFIWEVKRDWYGIDDEYLHSNPDVACWKVFLGCQYTHDYLDFMPQKAIQESLERISDFYQNKNNVLENWIGNRPKIYLSTSEMDGFVEDTGRQLMRIYQFLRRNDVTGTDCISILELQTDGSVKD